LDASGEPGDVPGDTVHLEHDHVGPVPLADGEQRGRVGRGRDDLDVGLG
jgi:hypothetical protein